MGLWFQSCFGGCPEADRSPGAATGSVRRHVAAGGGHRVALHPEVESLPVAAAAAAPPRAIFADSAAASFCSILKVTVRSVLQVGSL